MEEPNHWDCCLLRTRRERQRCRAADQGDELAPLHVLPSARGEHPTTSRCRVVQHSKVDRRMVEMGHKPRRQPRPSVHALPLLPQKLT
jgi:hypothetical protein